MKEALKTRLPDDYSQVIDVLSEFTAYSFAGQISQRMDAKRLSSVELARRCGVSHTTIDKWRSGIAKPNGKERFKELGMALEYDAAELNSFLLKNGYPALYVKNPLDSAARLLLTDHAGKSDTVALYRELVKRLGLSDISICCDGAALSTRVMSADFRMAMGMSHASVWFEKNRKNFVCDDKTQFAGLQLAEYILLYLNESSINEMAVTGELPVTLKNLLYPVLAGRTLAVRHLREKLIAFGLYANMTEDEINVMLECMKLRLLSEPETKTDFAILCALRNAHERYPYYEYENVQKAIRRLSRLSAPADVLTQYTQRKDLLCTLTAYYDRQKKDADDIAFEENYTSFSDCGVMDYVHDMLSALLEENRIEPADAKQFIGLLERSNQE